MSNFSSGPNMSHEDAVSRISKLFETENIDALDSQFVDDELKAAKTRAKGEFKSLALKNPGKAIELSKKAGSVLSLIAIADEDEMMKPVFEHLKLMAKNPKDDDELQFTVDAISLYLTLQKIPYSEVEFLVGICAPYLTKYPKCWIAFGRFYAHYRSQDPADLIETVEQHLDILNAKEDYAPIFKIVGYAFVIDKEQGKQLYELESVQDSIGKVNEYSSPVTIKEGLSLLSLLCSDETYRKEIAQRFLPILTHGIKSTDDEIQELSTLVIIKTWNFSQIGLENSLSIDDLYNSLTKKFTKSTVEGLAYLSIKPSVKKKLRSDDEIIFDLTKMIDKTQNESQEDLYGALVILANLTTIEEKTEVSELKQQAQKGLEDDFQEDPQEIIAFQADLLERNIFPSITARGTHLSLNAIAQVVRLIYNLSIPKENRGKVLSQAGLKLLLKFIDTEKVSEETRILAFKAISNLLLTTDPSTIFDLRQAQYALFLFLQIEELPLKDQLQALISLINANSVENGALPEAQWNLIDHFLNHENTLIRRSAIELVCNLVQHKDGVAGLFNFQNPSSKKRYDLLVQYTLLEDVKSQSSAVAALSSGATIPFIAEEIIKDESLLSHLLTILSKQYQEEELMERVLYVLYYLIFNAEEKPEVMSSIASNAKFQKGIELVIRNAKRGSQSFEMALEITKMVRFN